MLFIFLNVIETAMVNGYYKPKIFILQGFMEYKPEVLAYLKEKSVSVIFLFRRNILERYISLIANKFDQHSKLLNGTHRAHVHSIQEASMIEFFLALQKTITR